jgi:hypothetical protein
VKCGSIFTSPSIIFSHLLDTRHPVH